MKRILIAFALLMSLFLTTGLQAQNIHTTWRQKTIAVENGGEKPTVIQLLRAFNKVWHYKSTDALLAEAGDKMYVSNDATEGGSGRTFVDCEDYCHCWYDFEDSDDHMVEARTYQCDNGHLLFAVILAESGPKGKYFCCFYDYNPKTSKLSPIDEPFIDFKPFWLGSHITYALGEGYLQVILVIENISGIETQYTHYTFNGKRFAYDHLDTIGYAAYDESDEEE
jgi:hypothetical protein